MPNPLYQISVFQFADLAGIRFNKSPSPPGITFALDVVPHQMSVFIKFYSVEDALTAKSRGLFNLPANLIP